MASNQTVNSLGQAEGKVVIDLSSLADASSIVKDFVAALTAGFAGISDSLKDLASITNASSKVLIAQYQAQADEAEAAADVQVAAYNAQGKAAQAAADIQVQASKEAIAALQAQADQADATAEAGNTGMRPNPLGRSFFSLGFAASSLGLPQVAQPLLGTGAIAQVVGEIPIFNKQLDNMASSLMNMSGVFGDMARTGAQFAVSLGADAESMVAGIAAVGAVVLPVVAVIGVLVGTFALLTQAFQDADAKAQDYISKQVQINGQVATSGLTTPDIQKNIAQGTQQRNSDQELLSMLQVFQSRDEKLQETKTGSDLQAGESSLGQELAKATGGFITDVDSIPGAIDKVKTAVDSDNTSLGIWAAQLGTTAVKQNGATKAAQDQADATNAAAKAAYDEAQARQQLASMSSQQLAQRMASDQTEQSGLQYLLSVTTGKQHDAFEQRNQQLTDEIKTIQELQTAADQSNVYNFTTQLKALLTSISTQDTRTAEDRAVNGTNRIFDNLTQQTRAAQDATTQSAQQTADFDKQQSRAQEDYLTARAKTQQTFDADQLQKQKDEQSKIAQIMADSRVKILESAAELDAKGVYQEQQRRDQQIADQQNTYTTQQAQAQTQYQQQLSDQQAQFDLQRARALADFQESQTRAQQQRALQNQRQQQDFDLQTQRQQAQYALQDARRVQDNANQVATLAQHNSVIQSLWGLGLSNLQTQLGNFVGGLKNINGLTPQQTPGYINPNGIGSQGAPDAGFTPPLKGGNALGSTVIESLGGPNAFGGLGVPLAPVRSFDTGGVNFAPGFFYSGVPEAHIPLSKMGGAGSNIDMSGAVFNFGDIGHMTPTQVKALLVDGMTQFYNQYQARVGSRNR